MMDAVHRYEGTVNQVMGDGVMALFGAPIAHEDHAVRACYAAMAMPGSILITPDLLRLAEGYVQVKPLGPVPIKGLHGPMDVYEVMGAGPVRTRLQAASARGLTRFVGRHTGLVALRQAFKKARMGHGQAAAVIGEATVDSD